MSIRKLGFALVVTAAGLLLFASAGLAVEFSADYTETSGAQSVAGKIYAKGNSIRQEVKVGGNQSTLIVNGSKLRAWVVDPAKKAYFEHIIPAQALAGALNDLRGKPPANLSSSGLKITRGGTEKISGYPCEKTVIQGKGAKMTTWYSQNLDLVVKQAMSITQQGKTMTSNKLYKNIKEGKQPDSLFLPPKGYKKQPLPKPQMPPAMAPGRAPSGPGPMRGGR